MISKKNQMGFTLTFGLGLLQLFAALIAFPPIIFFSYIYVSYLAKIYSALSRMRSLIGYASYSFQTK